MTGVTHPAGSRPLGPATGVQKELNTPTACTDQFPVIVIGLPLITVVPVVALGVVLPSVV